MAEGPHLRQDPHLERQELNLAPCVVLCGLGLFAGGVTSSSIFTAAAVCVAGSGPEVKPGHRKFMYGGSLLPTLGLHHLYEPSSETSFIWPVGNSCQALAYCDVITVTSAPGRDIITMTSAPRCDVIVMKIKLQV